MVKEYGYTIKEIQSEKFKTASMAKIDFNCDTWEEVKFGKGNLDWIKSPKDIS